MSVRIIHGDCLVHLAHLEPQSIDAIVTDPPYGLGFMGQGWDHGVPGAPFWEQALRVAKPGTFLLAFGGTRTYHRLVCAIEDAGWEIRDQIGWVFGSGFPKSHNGPWGGTALKPAWEPICMARKPLIGTVEANYAKFGTGALNIDGCRIEHKTINNGNLADNPHLRGTKLRAAPVATAFGRAGDVTDLTSQLGRWPANLIHDGSDEVLEAFPDAPGQIADASINAEARKTQNVYGAMRRGSHEVSADSENEGAVGFKMKPGARRLDGGSAARFFYAAKASKADRDEGLEGLATKPLAYGNQAQAEVKRGNVEHAGNSGMNTVKMRGNHHPTVKPTDLMRYLCRLVTPKGGIILDPFMGSGSTGKAAVREGFSFIGVELNPEYCEIARRRIHSDAPLFAEVS